MKVIIEDLVKKMGGGHEQELKPNETIRFEFDDISLSCSITKEGLKIYKVNNNGLKEDRIIMLGASSNVILIK